MTAVQVKYTIRGLTAGFGTTEVLRDVCLDVPPRRITAIIGPSGCGKSTFIRVLNRMHELVPDAWVRGQVLLDGEDIHQRSVDPMILRRRVGMVFQKPNPFPTMSVRDNVLAGLKLTGRLPRGEAKIQEVLLRSLSQAALWEEVKDRMGQPGGSLSGGQQQRLCIARALAVGPDVLLMDEPTSALDPIATARIEDLLHQLAEQYTIVLVTHSMQQAARVSHMTAFLLLGELVEHGDTRHLFTAPKDRRTEDYITGRFG